MYFNHLHLKTFFLSQKIGSLRNKEDPDEMLQLFAKLKSSGIEIHNLEILVL